MERLTAQAEPSGRGCKQQDVPQTVEHILQGGEVWIVHNMGKDTENKCRNRKVKQEREHLSPDFNPIHFLPINIRMDL